MQNLPPRQESNNLRNLLNHTNSCIGSGLLKDAGYDVHALFMRNWDEDEDGYCTAAGDLQDARRVCDDLGIPLHAVTFAAGLAAEGMRPFAAIYSTFLQRAYDQVVHDVALQGLPVRFAIDRAGLVGADGAGK